MENSTRYHSQLDLSLVDNSQTQLVLLTGLDKKVLEVGPATGYITEALKSRGCRVTCIEVDPEAGERASTFCERMIIGDVEHLDFEREFGAERFDVAMFGDVLEHLVNPLDVLKRVKAVLSDGGCIVASFPNVAHGSVRLSLLSGEFRYTETGLLDRTHLRFFTRETLAELFQKAGYAINTWREVRADPFGTEQGLQESDYPAYLAAAMRDDPEALSFQFIVVAEPRTGDSGVRASSDDAPSRVVAPAMRALRGIEQRLHDQAKSLEEKAARIAALNAEIEVEIGARDAVIAQRDEMVAARDEALFRARHEMEAIQNSRGYRLLQAIRRVVRALFPAGSWRRVPYELLLSAARFVLLPGRGVRVVRREGWSGLLSRVKRRLTGASYDTGPKLETEFREMSLPVFDKPQVSIVIPVYNQARYTFNCLLAVAGNTSGIPYEVIVVNDGSDDETADVLSRVRNLRVVNHAENMGFVHASNRGVRESRGKYVVLLNNDTQVHDGWLRALVDVAEEDETVGLVGAKLVFANGSLQEAGGIVWRDATALNYGRHDDPEKPEYNYLRDVDYCSAACILVRRDVFDQVGGFDERYAPAYYEDTDLAFAMRELGYRVVYQPRAVVSHFEGVTSGTDTYKGARRYQEINRRKFREKWRETLDSKHPERARELVLAPEAQPTGKGRNKVV